eukprot:TRINITY_DN50935_c0_g2_i1.p1 TRINITY_DN50935_c0_g2~~TRINITY_DN50935_c0_g2_i1.p1  ORF type:complete len:551 (-),score=97.84 TRINITY_DN50935_c0_g2_i1:38-1690(-)
MEAVRSERKMDFTKLSDNNPGIGPGSYSTSGSTRPVKQQAAAFSTGAERVCDAGAAKFITPGPGSYVSNGSKGGALTGFASSNFKSDTKRFHAKAHDVNPAPGAYRLPGGIGDKATMLAVRAAEAEAPAVAWKRMQTAPSIPARHQSYGFKKSTDRGVVALGNKDQVRTSLRTKQPHYKGVDWSKNKTERFPTRKEVAKPPDPSEYANEEQQAPRPAPPRTSGGENYSQMLTRKRLEEAAAVPGPGSYGVPSNFDQERRGAPGKGFGTTSERFQHTAQTGVVGPGQYDDSRSAIKAKSSHPLATHITPFGTTSNRFGKSAAEDRVPGPGSYIEIIASGDPHVKSAGGISGGFGSCSTRFNAAGSYTGNTTCDVGPGTYDAGEQEVTGMLQKRRHNGMSSTFMSGNTRDKVVTASLGLVGQQDQPAPGDYVVEPHTVYSTNMNAAKPFGTSDSRWKVRKDEKYPSPGAYLAENAQLSLPRRGRDGRPVQTNKGGFNVNSARFVSKPPGVGRRTKQPGPGQYADGLEQATSCLLYTSPSPRDRTRSRMPSSA